MLFSSQAFIFGFLPATVILVMAAERIAGRTLAMWVMLAASLFFYAWWRPPYLALLAASMLGNYLVGDALMRKPSRPLLTAAITVNVGLIAYYKYTAFLIGVANGAFGIDWTVDKIALPLAISFFTFQQIAYLVDVHQGRLKDRSFLNYCLFVSFFPQLIAGPIVHHREVVPQYLRESAFRIELSNVWAGLAIFIIGLYKKVVFADGMAVYANAVFDNAHQGPMLIDAWAGSLAYAMQIYFDFSGYSDMAIGLARIFGIRLPLNFNSPYKATSVIEFWQRWHMTLSRFLRDYIYIPLGGSRRGDARRHVNVMLTMLIGGLWHGAAWTFVFWGGLHGFFIVINHGWRAMKRRLGVIDGASPWHRAGARILTFLAVLVAWTFFRAGGFADALQLIAGMVGLNGIALAPRLVDPTALIWLAGLLAVVWFAPNTEEWTVSAISDDGATPSAPLWPRFRQWLLPFGAAMAGILALIVLYRGAETAEFIYFVF